MPGFFDKVKSGAAKAAFEAERVRRISQAQGVLKGFQRQVDAIVAGWGPQVLELYDAGTLTQPELLAAGTQLDELRQKIAAQQAEIQRIREEAPPEPEIEAPIPAPQPAPVQAPEMSVPERFEQADEITPTAVARARFCGNCGSALPPDVKFCMECGAKVS